MITEHRFPAMSLGVSIDGGLHPNRCGRALRDQAMERLVARLTTGCVENDRHFLAAQLWFGWRGPWSPGHTYAYSELVTHRELVWVALEPTADEPGETGAWALAAERLRVVPPEPVPPVERKPRRRTKRTASV